MSCSKNKTYQLIKNLFGQENTFTIPKILVQIFDNYAIALYLNQIIFWSSKTKKEDGSFYKSYKDWEKEILVKERQARRYNRKFEEIGFLKTKVKKVKNTPHCFYYLDLDALIDYLNQCISDVDKKSDLIRTDKKSDSLYTEELAEDSPYSPPEGDGCLMEKSSTKTSTGVVPKTARGGSPKKGMEVVHQIETSDVNEHNSAIPQDYNSNSTELSEGEGGTNDEKSEFDRFWEIYPKKIDKQYAFKCWKRKKTYRHIDVVLEDLNARLKEEWKDKDKTYIKNASTYINRESWRDIFEQRNNITEIKTEKQKIKEQLELLKKQRSKK